MGKNKNKDRRKAQKGSAKINAQERGSGEQVKMAALGACCR